MSASHTPGPWVQHSLMVSEAGQTPGRGRDICHCGIGMRHDPYESQANAARIVQCVNAHDDLLAQLRAAREFIAGFHGDDVQEGVDEMLAGYDAAIAKATGSGA